MCTDCLKIIENKNTIEHNYCRNPASYVTFIDKGGLIFPSDGVLKVLNVSEKVFRSFIILHNIHDKNIRQKIILIVSSHFSDKLKIFSTKHPLTSDVTEEVHEIQLIKKIVEYYINIRGRSLAQSETLKKQGNASTVRAKLNKLIIFNHV